MQLYSFCKTFQILLLLFAFYNSYFMFVHIYFWSLYNAYSTSSLKFIFLLMTMCLYFCILLNLVRDTCCGLVSTKWPLINQEIINLPWLSKVGPYEEKVFSGVVRLLAFFICFLYNLWFWTWFTFQNLLLIPLFMFNISFMLFGTCSKHIIPIMWHIAMFDILGSYFSFSQLVLA